MKLPFIKQNRTSISARFGEMDWQAVARFLDGIKEGEEMEFIVRHKISWDVDKMWKYFHGPVCGAIKTWMRDYTGESYSKEDIKVFLKGKFLGLDKHGVRVRSVKELGHKEWLEFLNDIGVWTKNLFGMPLPEADEGE